MNAFFYNEEAGIKGPPLSLHPKIPAEAPPHRFGTTLRNTQLDEAEHL